MSVLRGFIPWIAYGVIASWEGNWRWAAIAACAIGILLILDDRRKGIRLDAQILEISAAIFFAALAIIGYVVADSDKVDDYDSALSFGWLAATAWLSLLLLHPFTMGIAKREVPQEFWNTEGFRRANYVITTVWAIAFTVAAAALYVIYRQGYDDLYNTITQVAAIALPIVFTNWYKERVGKAAAQSAA